MYELKNQATLTEKTHWNKTCKERKSKAMSD